MSPESVKPSHDEGDEDVAVNPVTGKPSAHPTGDRRASENESNDPPA